MLIKVYMTALRYSNTCIYINIGLDEVTWIRALKDSHGLSEHFSLM